MFSPDGGTLASASGDGTVCLWDVLTGAHKLTLEGHEDWVNSVAYSPDGRTVASGSDDNTVRFWDALTGTHQRTLEGHTSWVRSVAFSPDGQTLASGSWDYTIRLWDAETGAHERTIDGHTGLVWSIAFSPDGRMLAAGSGNPFPWWANNYVSLWDMTTGTRHRTFTGPTSWGDRSVSFSPDGRTLASGARVRLWDVWTGENKLTLNTGSAHNLAFSPDGSTIATAGNDTTVRLWDVLTGANKLTLDGHIADVQSVAFSPDGNTLASSSGNIRLWDVGTGVHLRTLRGHKGWVNSVAFSPDGSMLASGGDDITVCLWDVATGNHLRTLDEHTSRVRSAILSVAFSTDGRTLASTIWHEIRLWDVTTGGIKRTLSGHTDLVNSVAFSPDGRTLASGSEDGTVLLWAFDPTVNVNATANVSPTSVKSPVLGAEFAIALTIAETENVAGYQASLEFDPTAVRFVANINGDYFLGGAFAAPPVDKGNSVTVAATSLAGVNSGEGTLVTFTFEVLAFKESSLTLSEVILVAPDGERHFPHIENGQVLVKSPDETGIAGDVNRDGVVNLQDLVLIGSSLGQTGRNDADVNGDGIVDIVDLVKAAGAIGNGAGAPPGSFDMQPSLSAIDVKRWLDLTRGLSFADASSQQGVRFLESLLAALTPKETVLLPNYPNPFNPETWIPYHLANESNVMITIYDVNGMLVRRLDLGHQQAGFYAEKELAAYWDGRSIRGEAVASGAYFYQLQTGDFSAMRRLVIVK